jgi:signal transduction histidine kinase
MLYNFVLYQFYGLAFFTLGVAIFSKDKRVSNLKIAKILFLLASFGMIHGLHEWSELYFRMSSYDFSKSMRDSFYLFRLSIVSISFLFLMSFGFALVFISSTNIQSVFKSNMRKLLFCLAVTVGAMFVIYNDYIKTTNIYVRLFIAFPGAMLAGVGMIMYSSTVKHISESGAKNFILGGISIIIYGVLSGLIQSSSVPGGYFINVILFRGISSLLIMFFVMRALSIFDIEQLGIVQENMSRFSRAEKLNSIGRLASGVAHEINNPLTNASLSTEILKDIITDTKALDKLSSIERNIERASKIASELLQFSREKHEEEFAVLNLNEVIESTKTLLDHQHTKCRIVYDLREIKQVQGVFWRLEEVFINLIMNAVDASKEGGTIRVNTYQTNDCTVAEIIDYGQGIEPEVIKMVFDPFFTTKTIGEGTGLGLSICYNIVKAHGGNIEINSSEGEGTIVRVLVPFCEVDCV